MVCLNHPDREADYRCAACGKPICEECAVHNDGDVYCSDACMEKGIASKERSSFIIEDTARNNRKRGIKSFIYFVIIVIIAAAAYYFYKENKEKIDSKVSDTVQKVGVKVDSSVDNAVQQGHTTVPKDSKYRRQREGIVK